jgi:hypothetical protein
MGGYKKSELWSEGKKRVVWTVRQRRAAGERTWKLDLDLRNWKKVKKEKTPRNFIATWGRGPLTTRGFHPLLLQASEQILNDLSNVSTLVEINY